jgi:hypothetical protein
MNKETCDSPGLLPLFAGDPDKLHLDALCRAQRGFQSRCHQPLSARRTDDRPLDVGHCLRASGGDIDRLWGVRDAVLDKDFSPGSNGSVANTAVMRTT